MIQKEILEQHLDKVIGKVINDHTPGMALLISQNDDVLIRKAYGMADLEKKIPVTMETQFAIASNTKQFTCMAVMVLKEQGLLDYDETIDRFFPDFPDYCKNITIRHLMNHQSGLPDYTESEEWLNHGASADFLADEMESHIKSMGDLHFTPGTKFAYCNSGYILLGRIVEQLSGMKFGAFLQKNILAPAAMVHACAPDDASPLHRAVHLAEGYTLQEDGSFLKEPYDMALVGYADGNIQAAADDMLAWHRFLYNGDAETLISKESLREAFTTQIPTEDPALKYGFGFIKSCENGRREIWHGGGTLGFTSRCSRYIDDQISIIMLTNLMGLPKHALYNDIAAEVFALLKEDSQGK